MKTNIDSLTKKLMAKHGPYSTSIVTEIEPDSSSVGKNNKKLSKVSVKETIEETEKEAMKMYANSLKNKAKSEEGKRKKLLAQATTVANADIEAKDKIAQASQMAAQAEKVKVDKYQHELDDEAQKWVEKNNDLTKEKKQA